MLPDLFASSSFQFTNILKTQLTCGVDFCIPRIQVPNLNGQHGYSNVTTLEISAPRMSADLDLVRTIWDIIQRGRGITQFFLAFPPP